MKMIAPNIAIPIVNPIALATLKTDERKRCSGRIGSAARRSHQTKTPSSERHRRSRARRSSGEPHAYSDAAPGREEDQRADPAAEQRGAEVVDPVRDRAACAGAGACTTISDRERADGQVDVEDPAPGEVVDEEAAEQRAGDRRDREDGADQAHVAAALARRDDVGDDRLRADHESAGADSLQRPEADQLPHRLREAGEHRAGEEDQDRGEEDRLAADTCRRASRRAASRPSRRAGTR